MSPSKSAGDQVNALSFLSREEVRELIRASDIRGWLAVLTSWGLIAGSLAAVALTPIPWRWPVGAVALVVLGGRHLALAILMHDASHYSLFRTRWLNDWIGRWLCGYPTWQDLFRYRIHHLAHHRYAGTEHDPDRSLVAKYPTSRISLVRKLLRDLTGITGLKRVYGLVLMDLGFIKYTVAGDIIPLYPVKLDASAGGTEPSMKTSTSRVIAILRNGLRNLYGLVLTNAVILAALCYWGHGWLYALWVGSYLTTFSAILRIRSIAEHACTSVGLNPLSNTRTTLASPFARMTVAPHRVNYHLEHHLLMTAPYFQLPEIHRRLKERGALGSAHLAANYLDVLRKASALS